MSSIRVQQTWKITWLIVLKRSLYVVKEWPLQPKRHRVQTQSSWRGQGRFGRLAPRQSGRFHPANPVSYRPNVLTERILNHETHFSPRVFVLWPMSRFWSGSAERRQPGDLLAVRWISTSFSQHTVSVLWFCMRLTWGDMCLTSLTLVLIHLRRRTTVKMLCIYADYKSDESYTPSKISVRVGNNFHNLQEIRV